MSRDIRPHWVLLALLGILSSLISGTSLYYKEAELREYQSLKKSWIKIKGIVHSVEVKVGHRMSERLVIDYSYTVNLLNFKQKSGNLIGRPLDVNSIKPGGPLFILYNPMNPAVSAIEFEDYFELYGWQRPFYASFFALASIVSIASFALLLFTNRSRAPSGEVQSGQKGPDNMIGS